MTKRSCVSCLRFHGKGSHSRCNAIIKVSSLFGMNGINAIFSVKMEAIMAKIYENLGEVCSSFKDSETYLENKTLKLTKKRKSKKLHLDS